MKNFTISGPPANHEYASYPVNPGVLALLAHAPSYYERNVVWSLKSPYTEAANRYTLVSPAAMGVNINGIGYSLISALNVDLSVAANWDTVTLTDYTVAATRAGLNFYVYACQQSNNIPKILLSANSTVPSGYDASNSRKIAGFHCLSVAVGTIAGHTLTGFVAGDILPASIWDLKHRPRDASPEGMVYSDKIGKWVDIYLASGTGANTASVHGGTISDSRTWNDFVDDGAAVGKRLLRDAEFQAIAAGSNEQTNIAGSADPVITGGHSDTAGRRMISNIGCEDCCGVMWQWLDEQSYRYDPDGTVQAASKTLTAYHAAAPGGNPIYLKYNASGEPYLCCNLASAAVNKFVTFGSAYTVMITHDAAAATGGYQVYFDEDATQPGRLLAALPGLKSELLRTNNPNYWLQIAYNAAPGTPGVAITYDDGADNRLEFVSPTSANGTLDLALNSQTFSYKTIGGNKGQIYSQGTYGDVKLIAGAGWSYGSHSGSRARDARNYRWAASSAVGGRFAAEPV